jgi:hypothetical protein
MTMLFPILLFYLRTNNKNEGFKNLNLNLNLNYNHPELVNTCFSKREMNSFNNYYKYSQIIYGKTKKSMLFNTD